jgi:hypothetical protein
MCIRFERIMINDKMQSLLLFGRFISTKIKHSAKSLMILKYNFRLNRPLESMQSESMSSINYNFICIFSTEMKRRALTPYSLNSLYCAFK